MPSGKVTKRSVDALSPAASDLFLWDTDLKGFGVKITPNAAKSYVLQYRLGGRSAKTRRYTIGRHGSPWSPESARQRAQELLLQVHRGVDPIDKDRDDAINRAELNFRDYVTLFIERYAKREQPRSWRQAERTLIQHAVPDLGRLALPEVSRRDIARLIEATSLEQAATARYLHACLRKLFRWAVGRGDIAHSPMSEMSAPAPVRARDRFLADAELLAVWAAAENLGFPFGTAFKLLIATGQRREEVASISWEEIDWVARTWTIPASRTKNRVGQIVPLNQLALRELGRLERRSAGLVLTTNGRTAPSGWSKAKSRLDALVRVELDAASLDPWRTHDIRRTVATNLQRLGVRFEVTEAILNHISGARSGVAGVYQRHDWAQEKQAALDAWNDALTFRMGELKQQLDPVVVPMKHAYR